MKFQCSKIEMGFCFGKCAQMSRVYLFSSVDACRLRGLLYYHKKITFVSNATNWL